MASAEGSSAEIRITKRAEKDLEKLLKKDPKNFRRIWKDIKQFAVKQLPQRPKPLKGFTPPLWQVDSGDFRIFHSWEGTILWIRGVINKAEQAKRIRGIR